MTAQARGFQVSLALHALLVGAILIGSVALSPRERQILLDFSVGSSTSKSSGVSAPSSPLRRPIPAAPLTEQVKSEPEPRMVTPMAVSEDAAPVSADAVPATSAPAGDRATAAPAGDGGTGGVEGAGTRYVEAHFGYIRDRIMKSLIFPLMARKMGWAGKVTVSFIICEDGRIDDVRVRESSGHPVLDRSAVDTIRGLTSVPRPPVRAELIMPVVYRLQ